MEIFRVHSSTPGGDRDMSPLSFLKKERCLVGSFDKQKYKKTIVSFFFSKRTIH